MYLWAKIFGNKLYVAKDQTSSYAKTKTERTIIYCSQDQHGNVHK